MNALAKILVVEDDDSLREAICDTLELADYQTLSAINGVQALELLDAEPVDVVISDVQMPEMDGHELLRVVKAKWPGLPFVLVTAYAEISAAVDAIQHGAADYLPKPFEADVLIDLVSQLAAYRHMPHEGIIAEDRKTQNLIGMAVRVAASEATVMISGESGSGKEVFARLIHEHSPRDAGPFVAINCAAIPETMLESVLFGYEKGAFTGAYKSQAGKFEQAEGGTILLDEISEMDLGLQAKLLRVLQEQEVERLGSDKTVKLDMRVLATTNRDLKQEVTEGRFREDLFYRLNVFPLHLPPLRERREDILPLAQHFLTALSGCEDIRLSEKAAMQIKNYDWPGNVRELENSMHRAIIMRAGSTIESVDINFEDFASPQPCEHSLNETADDLKSREQASILETLKLVNGSRKEAAERLGISPRTLRYKLARFREQGIAMPASAGGSL